MSAAVRKQRRHAPRRPVKSTDTPTFTKLIDYEKLLRSWSPSIKIKGEFDVLSSLFGRTAGMGCLTVDITVGQLIAGNKTFPALGLGESTVRRHLARLRKRGIIETQCNGRYLLIRINFDWQPEERSVVNTDLSLVGPPDLSHVRPLTPTPVITYTNSSDDPGEGSPEVDIMVVRGGACGEIEPEPTITEHGIATGNGFAGSALAENRETVASEITQAGRKLRGAVLEGQWRTAWTKVFPGILCSVTERDKGLLRDLTDLLADTPELDPAIWIEGMFRGWGGLMHQHFGWMGKKVGTARAPAYPSIGFVARFSGALLNPWLTGIAVQHQKQEDRAARTIDRFGSIKPIAQVSYGPTNPHPRSSFMANRPKPRKVAGGYDEHELGDISHLPEPEPYPPFD